MLSALLEAVGEWVSELLLEMAADLGIDAARDLGGGAGDLRPLKAIVGYAILGGTVGDLSAVLIPHRVITHPLLPGGSLVAAPLLAGLGVWGFGALRRRMRGRTASGRGFWYGYLLGLALALVRLWFVA
jgi:hypothetical protein